MLSRVCHSDIYDLVPFVSADAGCGSSLQQRLTQSSPSCSSGFRCIVHLLENSRQVHGVNGAAVKASVEVTQIVELA